jgi:thiol-disulfide isomerase/thioredoxin
MILKTWFITLIVVASMSEVFAQNYTYTLKVKGLAAGQDVYLANYFGDRLYYYDTAKSETGVVKFERNDIKGGVYAIVLPGPKTFEIILSEDEQKVVLETDTVDFVKSMKVIKSDENKAFYTYFNYLSAMQKKAAPLRSKKDQASKDKLQAYDKEVKAYQKKLADDNKDNLFGAIISMSLDPEVPKELIGDTSKQMERYQFYKNHYFDNYRLKDARIVRTPIFAKKLKYFFEKVCIQHPDSVLQEAFRLIDQLPEGSDLFKYVVHTLTYKYETSKIMGMDAVFVGIALRYYCRGSNGQTKAFWLEEQYLESIRKSEKALAKAKADLETAESSEIEENINKAKTEHESREKKLKEATKNDKLKEICDRATTLSRLRLFGPAPDLILQDTSETTWVDIRNIPNEYKVLIFWDPGCGHCKKEIPKLKKVYDEIRSRKMDIEIIGINTELENKAWKKYIRENNLDWINISDNPEVNGNPRKYIMEQKKTTLNSLNFRDIYDIFSTPQIFLLDRDNNIVAKKIGVFNLVDILERKLKLEFNYHPPKSEKSKEEEGH